MKPSALATAQQAPFWQVATTLGRDTARLSNIPAPKYVEGEKPVHVDAYVKRGKPVRVNRGVSRIHVASAAHCDRSAKSSSRKGWTL